MGAKTRMLAAAAGLAAVLALPSAAVGQYYPPASPGGMIGQIIDAYRYGQYPYGNYGYNQYGNQGAAIDRCARAVEARINGNSGYGNWGYSGPGYNRYRNFGRVEGITRVVPKKDGFRVFGVASSGWGGYQGYNRPGFGNYGYSAGADLRWDCRIDRRGRISDLDVNRRNPNWRGY
jgi:hypothetical protein